MSPLLIVAIVIANAVMGVMQESKAEKALEALKNLSAPHARVLRDGKEAIVDASKLVVRRHRPAGSRATSCRRTRGC